MCSECSPANPASGALAKPYRRGRHGFTLLEVMVAISILGMALTVILSSQAGLFASASHARNLTLAVPLARCRMAATEIDLGKFGYPLVDQNDSGQCCGEDDPPGFSCEWKIETIELPDQSLGELDLGMGDDSGFGKGAGDLSSPGGNPLSTLSELKSNPSVLGGTEQLGDLAGLFGGDEGVAGLTSMVLGMVYPTLQPMLEASIRKVTVSVKWVEGTTPRHLDVVQFVTSPQQGGFDPNAAEGLEALDPSNLLSGSSSDESESSSQRSTGSRSTTRGTSTRGTRSSTRGSL